MRHRMSRLSAPAAQVSGSPPCASHRHGARRPWILVDGNTFVSFNRKMRVDPQHLRGLSPGLLNLSQLGIGGGEPKMGEAVRNALKLQGRPASIDAAQVRAMKAEGMGATEIV